MILAYGKNILLKILDKERISMENQGLLGGDNVA